MEVGMSEALKEMDSFLDGYFNCNKYIINVSSSHLATISKLIRDQESTYRMIGLRTKADENFSDSLEDLQKHLEKNTKQQPPLSPETIGVIRKILQEKLRLKMSEVGLSKDREELKQAQQEFNAVYGGGR